MMTNSKSKPCVAVRPPTSVPFLQNCRSIPAALLLCLCLGQIGRAQVSDSNAPDDEEPLPRTDWSEVIRQTSEEYKLFMDNDRSEPLSLQMKPVLRWGNNVRGTPDAFTYFWIANGRPEAVACIYMGGNDSIWHCFGSLSRGGLIAQRKGVRVWHPAQPGVTFHAVPDAPVPDESAKVRLRQMKTTARRFSAVLVGWGEPWMNEPLRMLPRELYRYQSKNPDLLDGAVFGFVQGTDPEALLLLEAVREKSGPQWQYALARRTNGEVTVDYEGKTVWKAPVFLVPANDPSKTFIELGESVNQ